MSGTNLLSSPRMTQTTDSCYICRTSFNSIVQTIGKNSILTGVFVTLPMLCMITILIYVQYGLSTIYFIDQNYPINPYKYILLSPVYFIVGVTLVFGSLAIISIKLQLHNLLAICGFVYAAVAYWAIINILIVVVATWSFMSVAFIGHIFLWGSLSTSVWLFTSAIMEAHRIHILENTARVVPLIEV